MKIADLMEKVFQLRTFTNGIIVTKSFSNFWSVYCRIYCSLFMNLQKSFCCVWRFWSSHYKSISLLEKLKTKNASSGCYNEITRSRNFSWSIAVYLVNWSSLLTNPWLCLTYQPQECSQRKNCRSRKLRQMMPLSCHLQ